MSLLRTLRSLSLHPLRAPSARLIVMAAASLGLTAACSDAPSAPRAARAPSLSVPGQPRLNTAAGEVTTRTFRYRPAEALDESFGSGHRLTMPAGAVCDPGTSGYGPGTWDSPCPALRRELDFTVRTWTDAAGRPQLTVSPDVRFVPGKVVTLRLRDREASIAAGSAILWCPSTGTACVDEAATDAALLTYRDASGEFVFRRLKHFSGYNVVVDRYDDGSGGF